MGSEDVNNGEVSGGDWMGEAVAGLGEDRVSPWALNMNESLASVLMTGGTLGGERVEDAPVVCFSRIFLRRSLKEPITTACDLIAPLVAGGMEAVSAVPADASFTAVVMSSFLSISEFEGSCFAGAWPSDRDGRVLLAAGFSDGVPPSSLLPWEAPLMPTTALLYLEGLPTTSAGCTSRCDSGGPLLAKLAKEGGGSEDTTGGAESGGGGGISVGKTSASADSSYTALPSSIETSTTPLDCDFMAVSILFEGTLTFLFGLLRVWCVSFGDSPASNSSSTDARDRLVGGSRSP